MQLTTLLTAFLLTAAGTNASPVLAPAPAPEKAIGAIKAGGRLPPGWISVDEFQHSTVGHIPIPDPFPIQEITAPSACLEGCIEEEYSHAGCQTPSQWDCLCRQVLFSSLYLSFCFIRVTDIYVNRSDGLAREVRQCITQRCVQQEDM